MTVQSRRLSAIEAAAQAIVGVPIGFAVSFTVSLLGLSAVMAAASITGTMFLVSTLRGYLIRRCLEVQLRQHDGL